MSYVLIIAEKPKVCQKIAFSLGKAERKRYGRVSYYRLERADKEIIVAPAVGHLFTLREKEGKFKVPSFELEWAPTHEVNKYAWYMKQYLENIKLLSEKADKHIVATDYDLEGDLIGANLVRHFGILEKAERMKFSTVTPSELQHAYENLEEINIPNVKAAETRHIIDWLYGINLSRELMKALRSAGTSRILSIGRVQGPFLRFLTERQLEIEQFKPKDFWELYTFAKDARFQHEIRQFFKKKEAEKAQLDTPMEAKVKIEKEERTYYPFPPFDFTSLQVEAYQHFGLSPIQTSQLAQTLYESALISYPRTDSQKLPPQLNLPKIIEKLSGIEDYSELAGKLMKERRYKPRQGKKEDVHPAIFPTGEHAKLSGDEAKLYNLIVSRFLACFAEPAEIEKRKVILEAGEQRYDTTATRIKKRGWLEFYPYTKIKETEIPEFKDGERVSIEKFEILKKQTTPPARYTPATIIKTLEEKEIGTKATRPAILDTLYKRGYISGKKIFVTPLGVSIYNIFKKYSQRIIDPGLTRQLEREMEAIQKKELTQQKVLDDAKQILVDIINEMESKEKEIGNELLEKLKETEKFAPCKCGGTLRKIQKGKSKFLGCTNYPKCKITYSLPYGLFSYAEQCPDCGAPVIWVIKGKQRWKNCLNRECPSKIKKLQEKERKKIEKEKEKKAEKKEKVEEKKKKPEKKKEKKPKKTKKTRKKTKKPEKKEE